MLIHTDSADHYSDITLKYASDSTAVITPGAGRKGTAGIVTDGATFFTLDRVAVNEPISSLELFRGVALKLNELPVATQTILQFQEADDTNQICIGLLSSGIVRAFKGDTGGTTLASSVDPLIINTYYYLETRVFIDNVVGRVVVKLWTDATTSATIIDFTGDTQNGGTGLLAKIIHGLGLSASWDDGYLCDAQGSAFNDFPGNQHVEAHFPNGAGFYTNWTPFPSAPNYANVNENPPNGDTSYNFTDAANKDSFPTQPTTSSSVNAVNVNLCAESLEAVFPVGAVMRQDATDSSSTEVTPTTDYLIYQFPYELAPDGGAWSAAKYNASESGYASTGPAPTVATFTNANPITIVDEDVASP